MIVQGKYPCPRCNSKQERHEMPYRVVCDSCGFVKMPRKVDNKNRPKEEDYPDETFDHIVVPKE